MKFQAQIEKLYIELFKKYTESIFQQAEILENSNELLLAFKFGKSFRKVCIEIGKDPRFLHMDGLKNLVRDKDREMETYLERIKQKKENLIEESKKKGKPEPEFQSDDSNFQFLIDQFYREVDEARYEIEGELEVEIFEKDGSIKTGISKIKGWFKDKLYQDLSEDELNLINAFRESMTDELKAKIKKPIPIRVEMKIFDDYAFNVRAKFKEYEQKGYYNSIRHYMKVWLNYLEKIGDFHDVPEREKVKKRVREEYYKAEDWLKRLEKKYEDRPKIPIDKTLPINQEMRDLILKYKFERKNYRITEENKRILKLLKA